MLSHLLTASRWRYASGWAPDPQEIRDVISCVEEQSVDGTHRLTATVSLADPGATQLATHRHLIAVDEDGTWNEWRIVSDRDDPAAGRRDIVALSYGYLLARSPLVRLTGPTGITQHAFAWPTKSAAEHLTLTVMQALADMGIDFVEVGDTPTGVRSIDYAHQNAQEALEAIAAAFGAEYLFEVDDENDRVLLHLVDRLGDGVEGVALRDQQNATIDRSRDGLQQRTFVEPVLSGGATIAANRWLATVDGTTITLADPQGGPGPIGIDGQLDGLYLEAQDRTTRTVISDSDATAQTVEVASATGFTSGTLVRVCRGAGGEDLTGLGDPIQIAAHGILAGKLDRSDLLGTPNLARNPILEDWSGGPTTAPDGYTNNSATLTRTTTAGYVQTGSQSCRIQGTFDGRGLIGPSVTIAPSASQPFVSAQATIRVAAGTARVELVATDGTRVWTFPDGVTQVASLSRRDVFDTIGIGGIDLHALGATSVRLYVVQHGATPLDCYLDCHQITESAGQEPFSPGNGANLGWHAAQEDLALRGPFQRQFTVSLLDLARLYGVTVPAETLVLGGMHPLLSEALGEYDKVRLLAWSKDRLEAGRTTVTLSNRPEDFQSLFQRATAVSERRPIEAVVTGGARVIPAVTLSGSTVTAPTGTWKALDVGATIVIPGADTDGAPLVARVSVYATTTTISIVPVPAYNLTGVTAVIGSAADALALSKELGARKASESIIDENGRISRRARDIQGREFARMFAKPIAADPDDLDAVDDGINRRLPPVLLTVKVELLEEEEDDDTVTARVTALDPTDESVATITHNGGDAVDDGTPVDDSTDYVITKPTTRDLFVVFSGFKTGCVTQSAGVLVPRKAAAAAGPSLRMAVARGPIDYTISAIFSGTLTYRKNSDDEGDEVVLDEEDLPLNAARPPSGSDGDDYDFFASLNGQTLGQRIHVPALGPPPQITNLEAVPNYSTDTLTVSWAPAYAPPGVTYNVRVVGYSANHGEDNTDSSVTSPHVFTLALDIEPKGTGGTEFADWDVTVTMIDGFTPIAVAGVNISAATPI